MKHNLKKHRNALFEVLRLLNNTLFKQGPIERQLDCDVMKRCVISKLIRIEIDSNKMEQIRKFINRVRNSDIPDK